MSRFVIPWSATQLHNYLQSNMGLFILYYHPKCLGTPDRVPDVMISEDSVRINGSNVTLTLSWREPFSYFASKISYTVSWNNGALLQNLATTDTTTRNYTITNLTPMTNYTFSVVDTNSFGSGGGGLLVYTTPGEGIDRGLV